MRHASVSVLCRATLAAAALLLAAPVLAQSAAPAAAPTAAPTADTLAKIAASKSITLGVRKDGAPFSYVDAAGKPGGFTWSLCQGVVQQLSAELKTPIAVKFEPVSLAESFDRLQQGRIDLHCGLTANTSERAQRFEFSDTFYISRVVVAHRAGDAKFASSREFGRTGVLQGSTAHKLMQTYAVKKANTLVLGALTPVTSYEDGAKLLKSGAIDTLVADELVIRKDPAIAVRRDQLTIEPYALVMRKGDKAFVDAVDRALHKVLAGPQGKQMAESSGLKVDPLTQDAWRNPNKQPAPPVL